MIAAPIPWITRAAISAPIVGAAAQASEAMTKRARPPR